MPWQYSQRAHLLTHNGEVVSNGAYSGKGAAKNNPAMEMVRNQGPIPRGQYKIGVARKHPAKGPITMSLAPVGHQAYGRTAFLIHGDSISNPGNASEGCVILEYAIRARIAASGDTVFNVVE